MLTIDDIRSVPLFSALAETELELIRKTSADIHGGVGEYAVHEGETERVLYAVLSGKMEVLKSFSGSHSRSAPSRCPLPGRALRSNVPRGADHQAGITPHFGNPIWFATDTDAGQRCVDNGRQTFPAEDEPSRAIGPSYNGE